MHLEMKKISQGTGATRGTTWSDAVYQNSMMREMRMEGDAWSTLVSRHTAALSAVSLRIFPWPPLSLLLRDSFLLVVPRPHPGAESPQKLLNSISWHLTHSPLHFIPPCPSSPSPRPLPLSIQWIEFLFAPTKCTLIPCHMYSAIYPGKMPLLVAVKKYYIFPFHLSCVCRGSTHIHADMNLCLCSIPPLRPMALPLSARFSFWHEKYIKSNVPWWWWWWWWCCCCW